MRHRYAQSVFKIGILLQKHIKFWPVKFREAKYFFIPSANNTDNLKLEMPWVGILHTF